MTPGQVTVFGASGFVGRYVVQALARDGWTVRAAERRPEAANFLRCSGDVGQIIPIAANLRDEDSVRRAVAGSDAVVNLVGILYESGRQTFRAVHQEGTARVAKAARDAGVGRLVQCSAIGAAPEARSDYARSKAMGEKLAREAFPDVTVIRPSIVFGPEDEFFNRFAAMARFVPALPLIGGGRTRFQPVYVCDVAQAVTAILRDAGTAGQTYELGGPTVYSFRELMEMILAETGRRRLLVPVPFWAATVKAYFLEKLPLLVPVPSLRPAPILTRDQVRSLRDDNIVHAGARGLAALGIRPMACEAVIPAYLQRYRRGGKPSGRRDAPQAG